LSFAAPSIRLHLGHNQPRNAPVAWLWSQNNAFGTFMHISHFPSSGFGLSILIFLIRRRCSLWCTLHHIDAQTRSLGLNTSSEQSSNLHVITDLAMPGRLPVHTYGGMYWHILPALEKNVRSWKTLQTFCSITTQYAKVSFIAICHLQPANCVNWHLPVVFVRQSHLRSVAIQYAMLIHVYCMRVLSLLFFDRITYFSIRRSSRDKKRHSMRILAPFSQRMVFTIL
jgi:hypothetical protein